MIYQILHLHFLQKRSWGRPYEKKKKKVDHESQLRLAPFRGPVLQKVCLCGWREGQRDRDREIQSILGSAPCGFALRTWKPWAQPFNWRENGVSIMCMGTTASLCSTGAPPYWQSCRVLGKRAALPRIPKHRSGPFRIELSASPRRAGRRSWPVMDLRSELTYVQTIRASSCRGKRARQAGCNIGRRGFSTHQRPSEHRTMTLRVWLSHAALDWEPSDMTKADWIPDVKPKFDHSFASQRHVIGETATHGVLMLQVWVRGTCRKTKALPAHCRQVVKQCSRTRRNCDLACAWGKRCNPVS